MLRKIATFASDPANLYKTHSRGRVARKMGCERRYVELSSLVLAGVSPVFTRGPAADMAAATAE